MAINTVVALVELLLMKH